MKKFNYYDWVFSQYTTDELHDIVKNNGLQYDIKRAQQELDKRAQEETDFITL